MDIIHCWHTRYGCSGRQSARFATASSLIWAVARFGKNAKSERASCAALRWSRTVFDKPSFPSARASFRVGERAGSEGKNNARNPSMPVLQQKVDPYKQPFWRTPRLSFPRFGRNTGKSLSMRGSEWFFELTRAWKNSKFAIFITTIPKCEYPSSCGSFATGDWPPYSFRGDGFIRDFRGNERR